MKIYVTGEKQVAQPEFYLHCTPAAELHGQEAPGEWLNEDGKTHKSISVRFEYGCAEVPTNLGEYLVKRGYAQKSKLIIPAQRAVAGVIDRLAA